MQNLFAKYKINFVPAHPEVALEPSLAEVLKGAKIFPIDADYAGANRKRIVDRWIAEVLNPVAGHGSWPAGLPARCAAHAARIRHDPAVAAAVMALWLLLGAVRRLSAGDAVRADADRPRHVHDGRHRRRS